MDQAGESRRKQEMERGRIIAGRAKRQSDLSRYIEGKKVKVMVALPGHPYYEPHGRVDIFYVDNVEIGHENQDSDEYPSETVMAKIALAVGATVGFDGIPSSTTIDPATRKRRDEYRARLGRARGEED